MQVSPAGEVEPTYQRTMTDAEIQAAKVNFDRMTQEVEARVVERLLVSAANGLLWLPWCGPRLAGLRASCRAKESHDVRDNLD